MTRERTGGSVSMPAGKDGLNPRAIYPNALTNFEKRSFNPEWIKLTAWIIGWLLNGRSIIVSRPVLPGAWYRKMFWGLCCDFDIFLHASAVYWWFTAAFLEWEHGHKLGPTQETTVSIFPPRLVCQYLHKVQPMLLVMNYLWRLKEDLWELVLLDSVAMDLPNVCVCVCVPAVGCQWKSVRERETEREIEWCALLRLPTKSLLSQGHCG